MVDSLETHIKLRVEEVHAVVGITTSSNVNVELTPSPANVERGMVLTDEVE